MSAGPAGSLDLQHLFTYHPPHGDQATRYGLLRDAGKRFAEAIAEFAPSSPERTTALARIREAVMWANAAIACNERPAPAAGRMECTRCDWWAETATHSEGERLLAQHQLDDHAPTPMPDPSAKWTPDPAAPARITDRDAGLLLDRLGDPPPPPPCTCSITRRIGTELGRNHDPRCPRYTGRRRLEPPNLSVDPEVLRVTDDDGIVMTLPYDSGTDQQQDQADRTHPDCLAIHDRPVCPTDDGSCQHSDPHYAPEPPILDTSAADPTREALRYAAAVQAWQNPAPPGDHQ